MTDTPDTYILAVNCGSSSLKFCLYRSAPIQIEFSGTVSTIGADNSRLEIKDSAFNILENRVAHFKDMDAAANVIIDWLKNRQHRYPLVAIGHRIVQGGPEHRQPEKIIDELLQTLHRYIYLAPNHLPDEIKVIRAFQSAYPHTAQIACFDTSFHRDMPSYVQNYPLPAEYKDKGLMKYGFHGISYQYIMQKLADEYEALAAQKIIIAHLGNGASMAAVINGSSFDTTMGMSPMGGLVMGTRSGDLDPGVLLYLLNQYQLSPAELDDLLSKHSGLKAIAGVSDVQELLDMEADDIRAKEALTTFCYSAKKFIGMLAAAMGGLDILVFTGGIGENSSVIRDRICRDLDFIGIDIDKEKNLENTPLISKQTSRVSVRVIKTNEELMIANLVAGVLDRAVKN
ncbi:acetate/propionate family kinase [Mucilaginibacter sp. HC2]|uniref:acetate/propionate family kinase n=1 Tax=Mucilaginibacter TaxID=423349 RepID=UPI000DCEF593|nr:MULTISPECIES: acetate/propionate family kinase [Mucilaginibacter]NHA05576.1 acetate/propionate family kinase [Mucilaginibacter inviolabilis]QTE35384.1 acetate/propionate family kinase [Mucilaginibacter gossypii]RAV59416.1 acetate/propionate family kinase [Mucilaginibacter rubeus]